MSNAAGLLGRLALLVGIVAASLIVVGGPLYRFAHIDLRTALQTLPTYGVYAAMGTGVLIVLWLVVALVTRSSAGLVAVILAVVLAGTAAYFPLTFAMTANALPKIHDITTDTGNPPVFVALLPARKESKNGADYDPANAAEQQKGYPEIQTFNSDKTPAELFDKAKTVATAMGWEIAASEPAEGRIEATDTTMWFGFKDDIVIRIVADGTGSKLDIRSMSRVGVSDVGKNAARIRDFLARLKAA
jgi:uncharacterized protein (DUF1499 family)